MKKLFKGAIITVLLASTFFVGYNGYFVVSGLLKQAQIKDYTPTTQEIGVTGETQNRTTQTKLQVSVIKPPSNRVLVLFEQVSFNSSVRLEGEINKLAAESSAPIYILLDSPGGSVFDGARVINAIQASKAPVYTVVTGLCASMCAMIHSYGTKRLANNRAVLMYHPGSGGVRGEVERMMSLLEMIKKYLGRMNENVLARSKLSSDKYELMVMKELWIDSEDALTAGLIDSVVYIDSSAFSATLEAEYKARRTQTSVLPSRTQFEINL